MTETRKALPLWALALAGALAASWAGAAYLWWELTTLESYVEAIDQRLQDEIAEREMAEHEARRQ